MKALLVSALLLILAQDIFLGPSPAVWRLETRVDTVNNTTAFVPCNGLEVNVVAGKLTRFRAITWYTASAITIGSAWAVNGPAFTTLAYESRWGGQAGTQFSLVYSAAYNFPDSSFESPSTSGNVASVAGIVVPSVNGILRVSFRSETNGGVITCKAGSSLEYW